MIKSKYVKGLLPILTILLLSVPAILYLFHSGYPQTDDGNWMIIRFSAFYEALRDGQFPVRWLSRLNNGYGYPVANFLYPGYMYVGIPLIIVTSSFVTTIKLLFAGSLLASSVGAYLWLRQRFPVWLSMIGGLIYLYLPYHLYDATMRGSLGELLALAIIPYVFWAIEKQSKFAIAIFLGIFLISHNILVVLFLPLIFLYHYFVLRQKKQQGMSSWSGVIVGIGLSLFFWIPALTDLSATIFNKSTVSNWNEYFAGITIIGWTAIIVFVGSVAFYLSQRKVDSNEKQIGSLFIIVLGVSLFLSNPFSGFIWNILPVQFIQFPFRFLSLSLISLAFLIPWILSRITKFQKILGILLVLITFITCLPYLTHKEYQDYEEGYYTTNMDTTTVKNEYMPRSVTTLPASFTVEKINSEATITNQRIKSNAVLFQAESEKETKIIVRQVYFPGWIVKIDKTPITINPSYPEGFIEFNLPQGTHEVEVLFTETPIRLLADILTLISFVICVIFGIQLLKRLR